MTYKDDLIKSIDGHIDIKETSHNEYVYEEPVEKIEILETIKEEIIIKEEVAAPVEDNTEEEEKIKQDKKEKNTNWTNLLLGKLK